MANNSALNDSLNKLSELSSSGEVARVNRAKRRNKGKSESAKSLLGNLLDDSVAAAEEERLRDEARKRAEEEEALRRKEHDEEMAKLQAEQAILAEQNEIEERKMRQAEMQAQLQRQKDIEAGIIDLEEEARQKRAEEERLAAIAAEKARKEAEKIAAQKLRIEQQNELEALRIEEANAAAAPKKNSNFLIIALAAAIIIAVAFLGYRQYDINAKIDYYALEDNCAPISLTFVDARMDEFAVASNVVTQEAPPKPAAKKSGAKKKTAQPAAAKPAPSLTAGRKGGLFGSGKL